MIEILKRNAHFLTLAVFALAASLSAQVSNPSGLTGQFGNSTASTPTAAATIYVGVLGSTSGTVTSVPRWKAPRACTALYIAYAIDTVGTKDTTANNFTLKLYDLTTSTAFSDSAWTGTAQNPVASGSVAISDAIAKDDELQVQVIAPASYGTPPTNIVFAANMLCQ